MTRLLTAFAVVALAATALPSSGQAYCRGCAIDTADATAPKAVIGTAAASARAYEPAPAAEQAAPDLPADESYDSNCRIEQRRISDGTAYRWQRVEVCE